MGYRSPGTVGVREDAGAPAARLVSAQDDVVTGKCFLHLAFVRGIHGCPTQRVSTAEL